MNEYSKEDEERNTDNENVGIYSDEGREELIEKEDEITDIDEGFMKGYNEFSSGSTRCKNCKTILEGPEVIEYEFDGKTHKFCSQRCLTEFEIDQQEKED